MAEQHYTLIDVCWTLFYSNTTFDFLDFAIKDKRYNRLRKFRTSWIGRKANLLIYKLFRYDWMRSRSVRYLAGMSRIELQDLAERFYQEYLIPRRIEQVWQQLPGTNLVIVSGTLDIIAQTVSRHLGTNRYHATEMVFTNDIFTGKFNDRLLTKASAFPHYDNYDIITDNLTDIDLVRKAQKATIVLYNNRHRWAAILPPDANITYIETAEQRY